MKHFLFFLLFVTFSTAVHAQNNSEGAALEALGGLSATALYNTFVTVGLTADAFGAEVYENEFVHTILDEQVGFANNIQSQYDNLLTSGFLKDKSDVDFIKEMKTGFDLVLTEIGALKVYVDDRTTANHDKFQTHRGIAWEKIKVLLDIKD